ncbi:MAG: response regulator transcription factor [Bdellovibrionaceae bacterium]|nr:response regulator transcription factor [Pseudobdellovibrionaceae bacterium]
MLRNILVKNGLSPRESEVGELVTQGLSNKEIADRLFVTEKTIKFHLTNIYKKMQVKSRSQLIVWCMPHLKFIDMKTNANQTAPGFAAAGGTTEDTSSSIIPAGRSTISDNSN